jgi:GT2 family glycosyltransferase
VLNTAVRQGRNPTASIVILAHRDHARLAACIRSLAPTATQPHSFEVIVLLNAADSELRQYGRDLQRQHSRKMTVIESDVNLGFIAGCNRAAAEACGEFIVLLNDDAVVEAGWLDGLVSVARANPHCGAVGSCILFPNGRLQEAGSIVWSDGSTMPVGRGQNPSLSAFGYVRETDYCSGCSLLIRRTLWQRLGGLSEQYFPMYYEDVDICLRLNQLGHPVLYSPLSRVRHAESQTVDTGYKSFLMSRNQHTFASAWASTLQWHHRPQPCDTGAVSRAINRARGTKPRLLVIDDQWPDRCIGSGFGRMMDVIAALAECGFSVSLYPANGVADGGRELQLLGVEVLSDTIDATLSDPSTFYDLVLISRPHNFARFAATVRQLQPQALLVYDAEALFHKRLERQLALSGGSTAAVLAAEVDLVQPLESNIRRHCDAVVTLSDEEAAFFERAPGKAPVLRAGLWSSKARHTTTPFSARVGIGFVAGWQGGMGSPNADALQWFYREVWPLICRQQPGTRLFVTGDCPASLRRQCGEGVTYLGLLPEVNSFYERIRVAIVPERFGAGVKYKLVEALQSGVPVVTTVNGAEGLPPAMRGAVRIAPDAQRFTAAIVELISAESAWQTARRSALESLAESQPPEWPQLVRDLLQRRVSIQSVFPLPDVNKETPCVHSLS